jgi:hypothetical protein
MQRLSPRRDSIDSMQGGDGANTKSHSPPLVPGENVKTLRAMMESKDKALASTSHQVNELIGKAGTLRRQLDDAQKQLAMRAGYIEELQEKVGRTFHK